MLLIAEFRIFLNIFLTRLGKIMKVQSIQNYAFTRKDFSVKSVYFAPGF